MVKNGTRRPRVLVADEDAATRSHLAGILQEGGYNAEETAAAEAVIERIRTGQVVAAILDPDLPDRSGLEVVRATLRGGVPEVPLIFCTSSRNVERATEIMRAGAWDWLTRPFPKHRLLNSLDDAVKSVHHRSFRGCWVERDERERQAQRLEIYGRFAAGVIHDFNNLLTIIKGFGDLLHRSIRTDEGLRGQVDEICRAADRGQALTQQLLAFGTSAGKEVGPVDLNSVVLRAQTMLGLLLGNIHIETRLAPQLDLILADPAQLDQVIVNLAINARDAMPGGGRLILETANAALHNSAKLGDIPAGDYVLLIVSDTGTGMSEETLSNLFEPFFTTKAPSQGTGLGLTVVRRIIDQSGGHIRVHSQPGAGTTFQIYWPRL